MGSPRKTFRTYYIRLWFFVRTELLCISLHVQQNPVRKLRTLRAEQWGVGGGAHVDGTKAVEGTPNSDFVPGKKPVRVPRYRYFGIEGEGGKSKNAFEQSDRTGNYIHRAA